MLPYIGANLMLHLALFSGIICFLYKVLVEDVSDIFFNFKIITVEIQISIDRALGADLLVFFLTLIHHFSASKEHIVQHGRQYFAPWAQSRLSKLSL